MSVNDDQSATPQAETASASKPAAKRTRTVSWDHPLAAAAQIPAHSGRAFLERMAAGELPPPPIARLFGMELVEIDDGRVAFAFDVGEFMYNPIGSVHGGAIATLMDSAMACAVQTKLPQGVGYTTLEIKINFIRAVTASTKRVIAEARIVHVGSRSGIAEADLRDEAGKLYAFATTSCLIFPIDKPK